MRVLGLDPGEKRIGVAISDPLGITAQGIDVLTVTDRDEALRQVAAICRQFNVEKIVVGNPLNMNGTKGAAAEQAALFADNLRKNLDLPVIMIDERLTTARADRTLLAGDVSRKKRRSVRDKLAAVLILEAYLSACEADDK